jgi:hypothetical protein
MALTHSNSAAYDRDEPISLVAAGVSLATLSSAEGTEEILTGPFLLR